MARPYFQNPFYNLNANYLGGGGGVPLQGGSPFLDSTTWAGGTEGTKDEPTATVEGSSRPEEAQKKPGETPGVPTAEDLKTNTGGAGFEAKPAGKGKEKKIDYPKVTPASKKEAPAAGDGNPLAPPAYQSQLQWIQHFMQLYQLYGTPGTPTQNFDLAQRALWMAEAISKAPPEMAGEVAKRGLEGAYPENYEQAMTTMGSVYMDPASKQEGPDGRISYKGYSDPMRQEGENEFDQARRVAGGKAKGASGAQVSASKALLQSKGAKRPKSDFEQTKPKPEEEEEGNR